MSITWENPPPKATKGRGAKYIEALRELKANPGRWGIIAETPNKSNVSSYVYKWKKAEAYSEFNFDEFDFTSREEGKVLYGRYTGELGEVVEDTEELGAPDMDDETEVASEHDDTVEVSVEDDDYDDDDEDEGGEFSISDIEDILTA